MNKKNTLPSLFVFLIVLMGLASLFLLGPEPKKTAISAKPNSHPRSAMKSVATGEESIGDEVSGLITSMLNAPIAFYGKIVDQNGNPVPLASVSYGLLDKFNEPGSVGKTSADGRGNFTIEGVRGAVISVSVNKKGFYHVEDLSKGSFAYGYGPDSTIKPAPTKTAPAVFVLHKMGNAVPLVYNKYRSFLIRKDGSPVTVDLITGKPSDTGQLKVEAWTKEKDPNGPRSFDWKCRISTPGGGITERNGEFDFSAPPDGYREFDEIAMSKNAEQWSSQVEKEYFLRLADGRFARIRLRMIAGGSHFFNLESYLNPKVGSRNLEPAPEVSGDLE